MASETPEIETISNGNVTEEVLALQEPQSGPIKISEENTTPNLEVSSLQREIAPKVEEPLVQEPITEYTKRCDVAVQTSAPTSINITFPNAPLAQLYTTKFVKFLSKFAEFQVYGEECCLRVDIDDVIGPDWVVISETELDSSCEVTEPSLSPSRKRKKHNKVKKELFVLDNTPSSETNQSKLKYTTKFTINTEKEENLEQVAPVKQSCFNCCQAHNLRDCKEPKNYAKINSARGKFRTNQMKHSRYHLDDGQKYSHLVPGKISHGLRKALGLHRDEAPPFIYKMRRLGYPPGWLEEAKFSSSDLQIIDIEGNSVKAVKKVGVDPEKIIEFPGFNAPFEKGIKDDHRRYGVPPYCPDFSKYTMIVALNQQTTPEQDNLEACDMDIDNEPENVEKTGNSPSLVDLEEQKELLLKELNEEPPCKVGEVKDVVCVKTSSFGTPVLKSSSPYSRLPNADNFAKDISPVIHFENLPCSTGKYEQMTDVLQKVRSTLKKIQNCTL